MWDDSLSRRGFIGTSAAAGVVLLAAAQGKEESAPAPAGPVPVALIGCGVWGKQILRDLSRLPAFVVKAVCDPSAPALKQAGEIAPGATALTDYRRALDDKSITAVLVATPSHQHKAPVLDALAAGKHVYCEAPLASHLDDARAIAKAGLATPGVFQAGLLQRTNPISLHAMKFFRTGVLEDLAGARAQWHRKESWLRGGATPERAKELNWRLYSASSAGLPGEVGIHPIDYVTWMMKKPPKTIRAWGGVRHWKDDDREVADTVHCVLEYPRGRDQTVELVFEATLANSFGGTGQVLYGSGGAILIRDMRAWLFKEPDAAVLGWEFYARQDKYGDDQGIVLVANSTKLLEQHLEPSKVGNEQGKDALYYALEAFAKAVTSGETPCDAKIEFQATAVALKVQEAVVKGETVTLDKALFDLG